MKKTAKSLHLLHVDTGYLFIVKIGTYCVLIYFLMYYTKSSVTYCIKYTIVSSTFLTLNCNQYKYLTFSISLNIHEKIMYIK